MARTGGTLVRIVVAAGLMGLILWFVSWEAVERSLREADYVLLVGVLGVQLAAYFIQGWRLWVMARTDGGKWPFWRVEIVNYAAMCYDVFTPGRIGSDACRIWCFRENGGIHRMASVLLAMRFQSLCVCGCFVAVSAASHVNGIAPAILIAAAAAAALAAGMKIAHALYRGGVRNLREGSWNGGVKAWAARHILGVAEGFESMGRDRRAMAVSTVLTVVFVAVSAWIYSLVGKALGMEMEFAKYLWGVPALMLAAAIPVTVQGRGITEGLAIMLWQTSTVTPEQIVLVCLGVYAVSVVHAVGSGAAWFFVQRWMAGRGDESQPDERAAECSR